VVVEEGATATFLEKPPGGRQAGRPGADDGDAFARRGLARRQRSGAGRQAAVAGAAVKQAYP
jgi:hypothetical protein